MTSYVKLNELVNWRYWLHLLIIAVIVLGLLELLFGGRMFTLKNVLVSVPLLGFADIVAHWIAGLE